MAFEIPSDENIFPPLPRWPAEVYPDEAAHGFFQRLTLENGQASVRTLATNLGLNARNILPESFLELAMRFPALNRDELVISTPRLRGNIVTFRGQQFRYPRDWSTRRLRVCPGCLGEKAYHRAWFDLNVLGVCPIHACQLIDSAEGDQFGWWYPQIGVGPTTGLSVVVAMPRVEPPESFERYILGRLGIMTPLPIPLLDAIELYKVVDFVELCGRVSINGWSRKAPRRLQKFSDDWRRQMYIGFEIAKFGSARIVELLQKYVANSQFNPRERKINFNIYDYWGWVYPAILSLNESRITVLLRRSIEEISAERGVYARKGGSVDRRLRDAIGIKDLSGQLGIGLRLLRHVTNRIGLTEEKCPRGQGLYFGSDDVRKIKIAVDDLVTSSEAAAILNFSWKKFRTFCRKSAITPFFTTRNAARSYFLRSEIIKAAQKSAQSPR